MAQSAEVQLDAGLIGVLGQIARERPNRQGWAGRPKAAALSAITTLRSLGLIETLTPLARPEAGGQNVLLRITPDGARALAGASGARL